MIRIPFNPQLSSPKLFGKVREVTTHFLPGLRVHRIVFDWTNKVGHVDLRRGNARSRRELSLNGRTLHYLGLDFDLYKPLQPAVFERAPEEPATPQTVARMSHFRVAETLAEMQRERDALRDLLDARAEQARIQTQYHDRQAGIDRDLWRRLLLCAVSLLLSGASFPLGWFFLPYWIGGLAIVHFLAKKLADCPPPPPST